MCSVIDYYKMRFINKSTTPSSSHSVAPVSFRRGRSYIATPASSVTSLTVSKNSVIMLAVLAIIVAVAVIVVLTLVIICIWRRRIPVTSRCKSKSGYYSPPTVEKSSCDFDRYENPGT